MMRLYGASRRAVLRAFCILQFLHRFVTNYTQRMGILQSQASGAATADLHMIPPHTQSNTPHRTLVQVYRKRLFGGSVHFREKLPGRAGQNPAPRTCSTIFTFTWRSSCPMASSAIWMARAAFCPVRGVRLLPRRPAAP